MHMKNLFLVLNTDNMNYSYQSTLLCYFVLFFTNILKVVVDISTEKVNMMVR